MKDEEMADKHAEEYTKKNFCGCCPLTWKNQCKNFVNCGYHDSWKDGAEFGYNKAKEEHEGKSKTAYIKGIRTMANALKDYDRTDGAWTDYFEHTVEEVLKRLLKESKDQ